MALKLGVKQLVEAASQRITTLSVADARQRLGDADVLFVDIRDPRELERDGTIPGAFHAPRGMLEFWVDPESPYYKPVFGSDSTEYILYCGGGWRSALAAKALQDMGMANVAHMDGGFAEWARLGCPVETPEERKAKKA